MLLETKILGDFSTKSLTDSSGKALAECFAKPLAVCSMVSNVKFESKKFDGMNNFGFYQKKKKRITLACANAKLWMYWCMSNKDWEKINRQSLLHHSFVFGQESKVFCYEGEKEWL